jgi:NAD(P)-dependent dehydrogenase (short-subunit alcohol dehydrogenase family)
VTICGRRPAELKKSASRHDAIHAQTADVTDADSLQQLYHAAQEARGSFAIVVANAGAAESSPAEKVSRTLWDQTIAVNLTGAFLSVQPALAAMRERNWGRIVFIASTAGLKGYAYVAPYVAAKHGVIGLTRALAIETAKNGITVNAVCPGYVETPMLERAVDRIVAATKRSEAETRSSLAANNPQARFIKPEEVAAAVVWLCAGDSAAITGQAISVSGGETW